MCGIKSDDLKVLLAMMETAQKWTDRQIKIVLSMAREASFQHGGHGFHMTSLKSRADVKKGCSIMFLPSEEPQFFIL